MSDEPEQLEHRERRRFGPGCVVAGIFFLPVLYALSPPIIVLIFDLNGRADRELIRTVYAPIIWIVENLEFVRDFYNWYFKLFGLDA